MLNRTIFESFRMIGKTVDEQENNLNSSSINSILEHLTNILNTRHGSAQIADTYGMPDLTNFPGDNLGPAVAELEKMIKTTIERYEPRLKNVKISYNPDMNSNLTIKFGLSAEIVADYGENGRPVFFETVITSDGIVKVLQ